MYQEKAMKLDSLCRPRLLIAVFVTALAGGGAQATDLYDSLNSLVKPDSQRSPGMEPATRGNPPPPPEMRDDTARGAQGPTRSDTVSEPPASEAPASEPPTSGQPVPAPSKPTAEERSP